MSLDRILVTGATGFLGSHLVGRLVCDDKIQVVASRRRLDFTFPSEVIPLTVDDISQIVFLEFLSDVSCVIHCAARAHIMDDAASEPLKAFRQVNVIGTLSLARQAATVGVRRFIFISSIKVNGEATSAGRSFSPSDMPSPEDPYGISKLEAELGLMELSHETGMEVVIIRPPLIYGPGVKGNFASLIKLMAKGLPMPLGAIQNKRSLVGIDNLVDLIIRCIDHPAAANQVFLAGDGEDLSTTELLCSVAEAMGRPARLIPVPAGVLRLGASLLGKSAVADRLLGSLQVDITKTRDLLDWTPPVSVKEGLRRCVRDSSV